MIEFDNNKNIFLSIEISQYTNNMNKNTSYELVEENISSRCHQNTSELHESKENKEGECDSLENLDQRRDLLLLQPAPFT